MIDKMKTDVLPDTPDQWCQCEKPGDTFSQRVLLYGECFMPDGWTLQYEGLEQKETDRVLYLMGWCTRCRGRMRSGITIPSDLAGAALLEHIYVQMRRYRPYSGGCQETGQYAAGGFAERARWYQKQDDLPLVEYNKQFLALFHPGDQRLVQKWLELHHGEDPYTKPKRDRKSTLFHAVLKKMREDGSFSRVEPLLDYYLPNSEERTFPDRDTYLTDYRFDISPRIMFGSSEGIYVDVYLEGKFDGSDSRQTSIGTFKTLRTDLDACCRMGELCGAFLSHGSQYINREIHRYTPAWELEAEYQRKLDAEKASRKDDSQ